MSLLITTTILCAQDKVPFNGLLLDNAGNPIKKVRVYAATEKDYTLTNAKGEFGLTNVGPNDTLKISIKKDVFYVPVDGKKSIVIKLDVVNATNKSEESEQLIYIGFGYVKKREFSGVSNIISGDDLRKSGYTNIISALQGRVPGLNISGNTGINATNTDISMRGTRTIMGSSTPLFILDGMVVQSFEGINLNDVDYVEVMKDASAYGSDGGNGAIVVHTKIKR